MSNSEPTIHHACFRVDTPNTRLYPSARRDTPPEKSCYERTQSCFALRIVTEIYGIKLSTDRMNIERMLARFQ